MKILAFDTSTKYLSLACLEDRDVKAESHEEMGIKHSEMLLPKITALLDVAGWTIKEVGLVVAGLGPGSFTGLRIGVATCKGLAAAIGVKVVGVPSIDAIAFNAPSGKRTVAPFLDAKKGKIYSALYEIGQSGPVRKTEYLLVSAEDFISGLKDKVYVFGDGVGVYKDILDKSGLVDYDENADWYPRACVLGVMGYEKARSGFDDPSELEPLYLHEKDCNITIRKKGK